MTRLKLLAATALLSATIASPVLAQDGAMGPDIALPLITTKVIKISEEAIGVMTTTGTMALRRLMQPRGLSTAR